jgi:hypothetical protein
MGRDFRYRLVTSTAGLRDAEDSDSWCYGLSSTLISRHNDYIIGGVYTYRQVIEKIRELTAILTEMAGLDDADSAATLNAANMRELDDVAEAISVYSRLLKEMSYRDTIVISYD